MKKGMRRLAAMLLCAAVVLQAADGIFADFGIIGGGLYVEAAKKDELKQQNEDDEQSLSDIEDAMNELEDEQESVQSEIDALSDEIAEIMASISLLEDEIAAKQEEIEQAKLDLEDAKDAEQAQYEAMKARIKEMYENGDESYIDMLFGSSSMESLLNKAEYIEKVHEYDSNMYASYQAARQKVEDLKEQLEIEESELEEAEEGLQEEMDVMEESRAELEAISDDYAVQISKAQQQAEVYKSQIKQRNAQIQEIEEAEKKAAEEAAKKAAEEAKKSQSSQSSTSSSSSSTAAGSAAVDTASIMAANGSQKGKEIAVYACSFVGNPYVAGGTSLTNGCDCSGFTQSVYKAFGYSIPRTSTEQRTVGTQVSYSEAQPGDIICYPGHVAIYIGNGMIVHASSAKTGIKYSNALYRDIICVRRIVS